ncbi:MBL fold metallo-hydrolase [Rhodohalobacter sp. SW132]|uniref:MBL fold metallo-hydrolase n=1 Tax=Rhodohalobacter sp. SW132 TaxID=2293433 RepID=UPI000E21D2A8|nr:MBL fold metallo-hydrolase [Rhodohalobacter sp. SW132]REL33733.1 MBL fold metallo-hydrolase [Rhodohalobacter sp. SW132]
MKIGRFTLEQLSEGFFELFKDGTFSKMDPARLNNAAEDPTLGRYSSALGIDPLLISDGTTHIVADAGLGWGLDQKSLYNETSNLITNLEIFGLTPDDISIVILTHLHYDHAAGCTRVDSSFKTTPTFPNARYVVQKKEWEFALKEFQSKSEISGADYRLDELFRLAADERFEFIDGNKTLTDGIDLILTGGHTPGHQIVKITDGIQMAYFLGDLIPTEHHLNHYAMKTLDFSPLEAKKSKTLILREAYREQAQLFFYHSLFNKNGLLAKDRNRNYILKEERR